MPENQLDPKQEELDNQSPEVPQEEQESTDGFSEKKPDGDPVHPDPIKP